MENSSDTGFVCTVGNCSKRFRRKEHLTRHLKSHDPAAQYRCRICGRTYARSDVLRRHAQTHHQAANTPESPSRLSPASQDNAAFLTVTDQNASIEPALLESDTSHETQSPSADLRTGNRPTQSPRGQDVHLNNRTESPPQRRDEPTLSETDSLLDRKGNIVKNSATTKRLFDLWFLRIGSDWPIMPSIDYDAASDLLIAAIVLIPSWFEQNKDHARLVTLVMNHVAESALDLNMELEMLQVICYYDMYAICRLDTFESMATATNFHGMLITACRRAGIFNGHTMWSDLSHGVQDDLAARYLAFAVMRIDSYLSLFFGTQPFLSCPEMTLPAMGIEREHAFGLLVRRSIDPDFQYPDGQHLNDGDVHHSLCAIQSNMWTVSANFISGLPAQPDAMLDPEQAIATSCQRLLMSWWANNKTQVRLNAHTASSTATLILYHASSLRAYVPPALISVQRFSASRETAGSPPAMSSDLDLTCWMNTNAPRTAVWHAGQIARIAEKEGAKPNAMMNPLLIPSLVKSAIVVCAVASRSRACPFCTGNPEPMDLVDLFGADETCERLNTWTSGGHGLGTWGGNVFIQMPICRCGIPIISAWYRKVMKKIEHADSDLVSSFIGLVSH